MTIIKGAPSEKWEAVQAIQNEPFVYIMSNGSKWAGEEEDDIATLLDVLTKYRLDYERFDNEFYSVNPCHGVLNPNYIAWEKTEPHYIDGPRMYECDDVYRFFGNFLNLSHVFNIDTNDRETIDSLVKAIEANKAL